MKKAAKFVVILISGTLILLFVAMVKWESLVQTYENGFLTAGQIRTFASGISVHSGSRHYIKLKFNGRVYRDVEGFEPYYLAVPELDAIIFVTVGERYAKTFHIFYPKTHKELFIDGGTVYFGNNIGGGRRAGEDLSAWVEKVESDQITVATRDGNVTSFISLDLKNQKMTNLEDRH